MHALSTRSLALAALCSLSLLALACGEASDSVEADADATAEASPATGDQLFDAQFSQVCRGTGQPLASEYGAEPGVHPVLFLYTDDGAEYTARSLTLPDGWRASWPELSKTQLVTCIRRVSETPGQVCEGYTQEGSSKESSVQLYEADYEYVVRNARTAEELDTQTFTVPAGPCPSFTAISEDDPQPLPYYTSIAPGQVELFLRRHVTGS